MAMAVYGIETEPPPKIRGTKFFLRIVVVQQTGYQYFFFS